MLKAKKKSTRTNSTFLSLSISQSSPSHSVSLSMSLSFPLCTYRDTLRRKNRTIVSRKKNQLGKPVKLNKSNSRKLRNHCIFIRWLNVERERKENEKYSVHTSRLNDCFHEWVTVKIRCRHLYWIRLINFGFRWLLQKRFSLWNEVSNEKKKPPNLFWIYITPGKKKLRFVFTYFCMVPQKNGDNHNWSYNLFVLFRCICNCCRYFFLFCKKKMETCKLI